MRMRRLKWAKEYIEQSKDVIFDPSSIKGNWNQVLNRDCIHIEIGSGKGDYLLGMAELYPTCGWVGIEKNESVMALSLRKIENTKEYVKFIYSDAQDISSWFMKGEVDVIHLNFSDPWPKNRTAKRRLSSDSFVKQYEIILKDDGEIQMKSDNRSLFEYSILQFQNSNFKLVELSLDYRSEVHDEDVISEYEQKFMQAGPIYRAVWKKVPQEV